MLIAVVILRPLVGESYDSAGSPITAALQAVSDPSPVRTLVFDVLILLATGGWLLAKAIGTPRPYLRTGLGLGAGLIAVAIVVSCIVAGNKRLAINASIDWLCYPVLAITLAQLLNRPWHRRLLLSAVLASACVQAVHCYEQRFSLFDETWEHYESTKEDFWANQGVDLDSAKVESFERRILSREASGFLPHSNITGSYLVLCGMAAVGFSIVRWRKAETDAERLAAGGATAVAVLVLSAVYWTKSLGAMLAVGVGLILWGTVVLLRRWIDAHRTKAFVIGWLFITGGAAAVFGHGLYHDRLPTWSMTFRWQYWRASADLIADHPLTGVGRENFGRHYLGYKSIQSPEEVSNPHNLFVQSAADWGVLGLTGMLLMIVGASWVIVRPHPKTAEPRPPGQQEDHAGGPAVLMWTVALTLVVTLGRLPLLGTKDPSFLYYSTVTIGFAWLVGFLAAGGWWLRGEESANSDNQVLGMGVAVGLFAFLLHDMINFAAFVPATATTLFALLALCIANRSGNEEHPIEQSPTWQPRNERELPDRSRRPRWRLALVTLSAGLVIVVYVAVVPVARAEVLLERARRAGSELIPVPLTSQLAHRAFIDAIDADPVDPTPCVEHTRWLVAMSSLPEYRTEALRLAAASLDQAVRRDPFKISSHRMQMEICRMRAEETGDAADYAAAVNTAERVIELYPNGPAGYVDLADRLAEAAEATETVDLMRRAAESYEFALTLDDQRLWWEELRRFSESEQADIRSKLDRAGHWLREHSP